jgi:hypothetical protein
MSRILFRRITTATVLAALLALAAPAQAAGWNGWASDGDLLHSAWQWVASFWIPQAPAHPSKGIPGVKSDRGTGIDPNGAHTTSTPSCCERGADTDPNG